MQNYVQLRSDIGDRKPSDRKELGLLGSICMVVWCSKEAVWRDPLAKARISSPSTFLPSQDAWSTTEKLEKYDRRPVISNNKGLLSILSDEGVREDPCYCYKQASKLHLAGLSRSLIGNPILNHALPCTGSLQYRLAMSSVETYGVLNSSAHRSVPYPARLKEGILTMLVVKCSSRR